MHARSNRIESSADVRFQLPGNGRCRAAGDNCCMHLIAPRSAASAAIATLCAAIVGACGSSSTATPASGGGGNGTQGSGCVSQSQAEQIWRDVDNRIIAFEADPKSAAPGTVATGAALSAIQQYLAQQLEANNWTEREVDKLDSLAIESAGCNGGTLVVRGTMTLVTDEYLTANGRVDHHDSEEGQKQQFIDNYVRVGGVWKQSQLQNPGQQAAPTATPEVI